MCSLPLAEGISPPPILPPLHFISVLGTAEEKVKMEMLGHHALRLGYKKIRMEAKMLRELSLHQLQCAVKLFIE